MHSRQLAAEHTSGADVDGRIVVGGVVVVRAVVGRVVDSVGMVVETAQLLVIDVCRDCRLTLLASLG